MKNSFLTLRSVAEWSLQTKGSIPQKNFFQRQMETRTGVRKTFVRERGRIESKKQYSFLKLEPTEAGYQLH